MTEYRELESLSCLEITFSLIYDFVREREEVEGHFVDSEGSTR